MCTAEIQSVWVRDVDTQQVWERNPPLCANHGIACEDSGKCNLYIERYETLEWITLRLCQITKPVLISVMHPVCYIFKKRFSVIAHLFCYIYICYLITLLLSKASGTIINLQTCLKESYDQQNLKCLKYQLNVELLQPSNCVIICVMGFSATSESRAGYKWKLCNFVQLTFSIVKCDNFCVTCISIFRLGSLSQMLNIAKQRKRWYIKETGERGWTVKLEILKCLLCNMRLCQ